MIRKLTALLGFAAACSGTAAHAAPLLFDSLSGTEAQSSRNVGDSPGSEIQVTTAITLTNLAVKNQLSAAGNVKFLIFNDVTNLLVFQTPPLAVTDTTSNWKTSPAFSFVLAPGTYDVGAIADVAGLWSFDTLSESSNGVTSVVSNPNFATYAAPTQVGHAGGDASVRLYGTTAVPEPAGVAALAAVATAVAGRRRRAGSATPPSPAVAGG